MSYLPIKDQNMRDHVDERRRGWAQTVKDLERVMAASPPPVPEPGRRYITAAEACADLGLEPTVKAVAEAEIRALVAEQKTGFSVSKTLRAQGVKAPVVRELLARGMRMVTEMRNTRAVADLFVRKAGPPKGDGWQPVPQGKKGGYRRHKSGGGYEYAYPDAEGGYSSHDSPAADEGVAVHEEHEAGTPDPAVRERMATMEAKAKAAGLGFSSKATSRTTMQHLNVLEKKLDTAIAQKRKRDAAKPQAEGTGKKQLTDDDVDVSHTSSTDRGKPKAEPKPEADEAPAEPKGDNRDPKHKAIYATADRKGVDSATIDELLKDPEAQSEEGRKLIQSHLDELPDLPPASELPDEIPDDKAEAKKLAEHAAKLEAHVARLEKAVAAERETHAKELAALRAEIRKFTERPTPRGAAQATHHFWAIALLVFGFVAGALFAGPAGALLGASMAGNYVRTGIAKSLRLSPGVYVIGGSVVLVKADEDAHALTVRENDPARIVAYRKAIVDELKAAPAPDSDDIGAIVALLAEHSPTWKRAAPYLSPDNRRKLLVTASAVLLNQEAP